MNKILNNELGPKNQKNEIQQLFVPSKKGEVAENQPPFREGQKMIFRNRTFGSSLNSTLKKVLTVFLLICTFFLLHEKTNAQGNLQFNRVFLIEWPSVSNTFVIDTVPQGKVWQVTKFIGQPDVACIPATGFLSVRFQITEINGDCLSRIAGYNVCMGIPSPGSDLNTDDFLPLWLPENTTIKLTSASWGSGSPVYSGAFDGTAYLSVTEYNIVQ